jgi:L-ascorbate metabolism protein UlaG (beta-lactamase superfamily)
LSFLSFVTSALGGRRRALPVSDHCDGERFFNPAGGQARPIGDVITWQRTRVTSVWPESVPITAYPPPPSHVAPGAVAATFVGHSTFLLRTSDTVILTDPVFTTHAGPFGRLGPRRVCPATPPLDRLPLPDVVLVSHNHYDHLQPSSLRRCAQGAEPQFVTALGLGTFLQRLTLQNVIELDWWETADLGAGRTVTCVPAQHFSARTPFDRNRTLWCGFVVSCGTETIYFAGDSGYGPHFEEIGRRCRSIDLALLPIGAYEPRWFMRPVHMNPAEAVQAHVDIGARVSLGMHFGTFQLTDEAIDEPLLALDRALDERGISDQAFTTLDFGESMVVGPAVSSGDSPEP